MKTITIIRSVTNLLETIERRRNQFDDAIQRNRHKGRLRPRQPHVEGVYNAENALDETQHNDTTKPAVSDMQYNDIVHPPDGPQSAAALCVALSQ